ncbi:hypothetical protein D1631_17050 [Chryseobacterium nematophagum]|uniref:Uncharacterized protein n=2 Tax=Chryseobacterium nematophagum TaxID=2305228 RepID=A0A3M7TJ85_9FLAO|nr:hypothetical protein D1631_17050 [Chryseobacterium nematophagum]
MNNMIKSKIGSLWLESPCYHEVSLQKIGGRETACSFDGKDYISLNPKDSECSFSYFRKLSEEPLYIDTGDCNLLMSKIKEAYRFVYFSKEKKEVELLLLLFQKKLSQEFSLVIKSINRDENKLLKWECGIVDHDIKLKNWTYFSIDFQLTYKYDNCLISDCL